MTEESTEQATTDTGTAESTGTPATEMPGVTNADVRQSKLFQDNNSELATTRKQVAELEAWKAEREKAELEKQGKYQELNDAVLKEKEALAKALADTRMESLHDKARFKLHAAGMTDEWTQDGVIGKIPADFKSESIDEWVAQLKEKKPGAFAPVADPISQPGVGPAATKSTGDLESRLKSEDPLIREAALLEQFSKTLGGAK